MFKWISKLFKKDKKEEDNSRSSLPLNSLEIYTCGECKRGITREELDRTWDWSGPSCPHCGFGGMDMFADVIEQESPQGIRHAKK